MGSAASREAVSSIRNWAVTEGRKTTTQGRATELFGSLVFNDEVQQKRLPKPVYQALRRTMTQGEPLDPSVADAVASALKDWAVEHGATHYTHWFQPLTGITAEKHDSFLSPTRRRQARSPSSPARSWSRASPTPRASRPAACAPRSKRAATRRGIRRARPGCSRAANGDDARHPDRVRQLDRRGARQEDAAAALDGSAVEAGGAHPEAVRLDAPSASITTCGPEQEYFLIDRNFYLSRARPDQRRPHAVRRQAAEGPGARGSVLRRDRRARDGLHVGRRDRALQGRRAGQDAPQRGGAEPVRDRADLRERQPRHRSSDDDDGDDAADGAEVRPRVPAAREAVRRRQRLGQAPQLVDERRRGQQPAAARATTRTTTCSSWCSARPCCAPSTSGRACCAPASPAPATITASARTKRRRRSSRSSSATC